MSPQSTTLHTSRRLAFAALACLLAAGLFLLAGGDARGDGKGHGGKGHGGKNHGGKNQKVTQPNIIVFVTDDQARSTITPESMPNLFTKFMPRGTSFNDYVVTTPLCCPSRAAYLTGQYGHNNGVIRNFYPDLIQKRNVLPSWLQYAGYNTAHVGKFLNSYEQGPLGPAAVAPGWDLWFTELEKRRYYNWKASKNGKVRHYGTDDNDQVTTVTNDFALRWTKRLDRKKAPFYMQVDYYAPHTSTGRDTRCAAGPVPEAVDEHRFDLAPLPTPPNYNEADINDKPDDIKARPQLTAEDQASIERRYRCTLEAVYGVDRGMGRIFDYLQSRNELKNTVFLFTSDNGFFYGEHRIAKGKPDPYEENIRMPLTMVVPPKFRNRSDLVTTSNAPVANIDLAPTLLDLADAKPCRTKRICRTMDGRSLMPIMDGEGGFPQSRAIGLELYDCDYRGVRVGGQVYIEHSAQTASGCDRTDTELYDLNNDPYQLDNLAETDPGANAQAISSLHDLTQKIGDCAGIEGRDPEPASGHYCQ